MSLQNANTTDGALWIDEIKNNPQKALTCPENVLDSIFNENLAKDMVSKNCTAKVWNFVVEKMDKYEFSEKQKNDVFVYLPDWLSKERIDAFARDEQKEIMETFLDNVSRKNNPPLYSKDEPIPFLKFDVNGREHYQDNCQDWQLNLDKKTGELTVDHGSLDGSIKLLGYDTQSRNVSEEISENIKNALKNSEIECTIVPYVLRDKLDNNMYDKYIMREESTSLTPKHEFEALASEISYENTMVLNAWSEHKDHLDLPKSGVKSLCMNFENGSMYIDSAQSVMEQQKPNVVILETMDTEKIYIASSIENKLATMLEERDSQHLLNENMLSKKFEAMAYDVMDQNAATIYEWQDDINNEGFPPIGVKNLCLDLEDNRMFIDYQTSSQESENENIAILESMDSNGVQENPHFVKDLAKILEERVNSLDAQKLDQKLEQSQLESVKKSRSR